MKSKACLLSLVFVLAGCVYRIGALRTQISRYEGDGRITDTSIGAPPFFWGPGFEIDFPGFNPRERCERSYTFKGVPKTKYGASMIYVRFPGDWSPGLDAAEPNVTSVLTCDILDGTGRSLKSEAFVFSRAVWSWESGRAQGVFALWMDGPDGAGNRFYFEPTRRYTLRIVYVPGPLPPQTTNMFISIENGGRI